MKDLIQDFIKANDIKTPLVDCRPSSDWLSSFLLRHPTVASRKTEHLSNAREKLENPGIIKKLFDFLEETLKDAGVSGLPN